MSINQLLKKDDWLYQKGFDSILPSYNIDPFAWGVIYQDSTTTNLGLDTYMDYYGLFSSIYALSRGGARIRTYAKDLNKVNGYSTIAQILPAGVGFPNYTGPGDAGATFNIRRFSLNVKSIYGQAAGLEVQCPMYSRYHARCNPTMLYSKSGTSTPRVVYGNLGTSSYVVNINNAGPTSPASYYSRQGADDTQFSMFVSIPTFIQDGPTS